MNTPKSALQDAVRHIVRSECSPRKRQAAIARLFSDRNAALIANTTPRPSACSSSSSSFPGAGAPSGCKHYKRNCWILADCCQRYYPCRRCHDEQDHSHSIDRYATKFVACVKCGDEGQAVASHCRSCGVQFARYFCAKCNFYDDTPGRDAYHCDGCGMCRVGKGLGIDNHHCHGCGNCIPIAVKDNHPCRERSLHANCPICTEYLATSTKPMVVLRCGHTIHSDCLRQLAASGYTCPICHKSMADMSKWYRELDKQIQKELIPPEFAYRRSRVLCHDCEKKTVAQFHLMYHKCGACHGYNTRVLEHFDIKPCDEATNAAAAAAAAARGARSLGGNVGRTNGAATPVEEAAAASTS
ncbi:Zinc finger protein BRUTUS-like [Gracilariopsis chorda]|uniref:Zinc finger protein BRUTUS-like n=1 Tax=Gracilariopsis chorda TaxID=448386 RepID=A0A2V3J0U0_9FLOR|nr:Zinc finger protein BRUTUS-like [Gracilariopsis chorda]|eukprot:PXF47547.1 Zinc finger protein BRUTUS-like [Gracilariopsis chorda]